MSEQKAKPYFPLTIGEKDELPLTKYIIERANKMSFSKPETFHRNFARFAGVELTIGLSGNRIPPEEIEKFIGNFSMFFDEAMTKAEVLANEITPNLIVDGEKVKVTKEKFLEFIRPVFCGFKNKQETEVIPTESGAKSVTLSKFIINFILYHDKEVTKAMLIPSVSFE